MNSIAHQILILLNNISLTVKEIIAIYSERGYSEMSIRNLLSSLKKEGLISSPKRGVYQITSLGKQHLHSLDIKVDNSNFDNTFLFVFINIPEKQRKLKDKFKRILYTYGFGTYLPNVFICPRDYSEQVLQLAKNMAITDMISLAKGQFLKNQLSSKDVINTWHLNEVEENYLKLEKEINELNTRNLSHLTPKELFNLYLDYENLLVKLYRIDPFLPESIFPNNFTYSKVKEGIFSHLKQIEVGLKGTHYYNLIRKVESRVK